MIFKVCVNREFTVKFLMIGKLVVVIRKSSKLIRIRKYTVPMKKDDCCIECAKIRELRRRTCTRESFASNDVIRFKS